VTHRIVIGNNKGGSGKTATAVNLAAALAEASKSVLVVDLDPQANATRRLGVAGGTGVSISEALFASTPGTSGAAADAVREVGWKDEIYRQWIDVIPARFDLENRISEAASVGAIGRLRRALQGVDQGYDFTLIDCPPSLGHLTQMAMAGAEACLATVEPEYDSVEGGLRYREFLTTNATDLTNPDLYLLGVIIGRVRTQVSAHAFQIAGMRDSFGPDLVWEPTVPERAVIKDAADASMPLASLGSSRARAVSEIFSELADTMIKRFS
jgi:chromosome partitioning protein